MPKWKYRWDQGGRGVVGVLVGRFELTSNRDVSNWLPANKDNNGDKLPANTTKDLDANKDNTDNDKDKENDKGKENPLTDKKKNTEGISKRRGMQEWRHLQNDR